MTSLFEAKNLQLGTYLSELSHRGEYLVNTASLRRKNNVKVQLKYIISPKRKVKKQFLQLSNRLPNI